MSIEQPVIVLYSIVESANKLIHEIAFVVRTARLWENKRWHSWWDNAVVDYAAIHVAFNARVGQLNRLKPIKRYEGGNHILYKNSAIASEIKEVVVGYWSAALIKNEENCTISRLAREERIVCDCATQKIAKMLWYC